jgi:CheY-like chemotaxis protein
MADGERNVLVIDDDPSQAALITKVLKSEPYVFTVCNDAESALVLLNGAKAFDLIFCDFMLPGISGLQTVEYIRRSASGKTTPIIMMSAHGGAYQVGDRAKSAGANAFMAKPFTASELRRTIGAVLGT